MADTDTLNTSLNATLMFVQSILHNVWTEVQKKRV